MLPDARFGDARYVGAFWTRDGEVELDFVGAPTAPPAPRVSFVGSVKWRARSPFDHRDLASLIQRRPRVPGAGEHTGLVVVSRSGFRAAGDYVALGPEDLLGAWRTWWVRDVRDRRSGRAGPDAGGRC